MRGGDVGEAHSRSLPSRWDKSSLPLLWDEAEGDTHIVMVIPVPVEVSRGLCSSTMLEQETELSLLVWEAAGEIYVCTLAGKLYLSAALKINQRNITKESCLRNKLQNYLKFSNN